MNLLFDNAFQIMKTNFGYDYTDMLHKFVLDNMDVMLPKTVLYKDLPNLAPPYQEMWFEWTIPQLGRAGVYAITEKSSTGWEYSLLLFLNAPSFGKKVVLLQQMVRFLIPPSGKVDATINFIPGNIRSPVTYKFDERDRDKAFKLIIDTQVTTVLFAIGLMHCKNIVEVEKGGKNPNIKNRRHRSKGTKHYVLDVIPSQNIHRTEYEQPAQGSAQRMHFRRGHFKEYTAEKPLFGKYVGSYWWEAHVAGSAKIGEIRKDYRILPMQQER